MKYLKEHKIFEDAIKPEKGYSIDYKWKKWEKPFESKNESYYEEVILKKI